MKKMPNIELWFPTSIYYADDILDENEINTLIHTSYDIKNNGTFWTDSNGLEM
jgi:hypothetical protein